jgi:phospholipid/cholesterol/gamma-HCH transport system substrate-binding protein
MAQRADEVKVGLVIIISLVILAGFVVSILGVRLGQPVDTYTTELRFAGGIVSGTAVRYGGMQVGKVTAVEVSPVDDTRIRLSLSVDAGLPIKTDSELFINTIGFLGDYYLEITTGSPESPVLQPGGMINSMEIAGVNEMFATAHSAIEKVDATMVILNEKILTEDFALLRERVGMISEKAVQLLTDADLVFSEENRANLSETLSQMRELVQENRADLGETIGNLRSATEKLDSLAATLDGIAGENREDIELLIDEITATVAEARSTTRAIGRLISENEADMNVAIDNLRATTSNTRDLSETLADEPWRILWRTRQPEKVEFNREEAESIEP